MGAKGMPAAFQLPTLPEGVQRYSWMDGLGKVKVRRCFPAVHSEKESMCSWMDGLGMVKVYWEPCDAGCFPAVHSAWKEAMCS